MYIAISKSYPRAAIGRTIQEAVDKLTHNVYNIKSLKNITVYKTDGGPKKINVVIGIE